MISDAHAMLHCQCESSGNGSGTGSLQEVARENAAVADGEQDDSAAQAGPAAQAGKRRHYRPKNEATRETATR